QIEQGRSSSPSLTIRPNKNSRLLAERLLITLVDIFPVHYVPPRLQVLRAPVVVLQIVRVLPHIVAEDGMKALRNGTVLVRRGDDLHLALAVAGQPDPSAAKLSHARGVKFF